jgi:hypothetical protein
MTHAKLDTQAERLAEIRDIAEFAEGFTAPLSAAPIAEAVVRLARLIEAEMLANDFSGLV